MTALDSTPRAVPSADAPDAPDAPGDDPLAHLGTVAVTQLRGGPGGTTFALGLAAVASEHGQGWLIEADPAGGVLLGRCRPLDGARSLVDLAFPGPQAPRAPSELAASAAQSLGRTSVIVGPEQPTTAFECVARPKHRWPASLRLLPGWVVVDCGRMFPGTPSLEVLRYADVVVVVTPPEGGDVYRFTQWATEGQRVVESPLLVTSGPGRFAPRQLARDVGEQYLVPVPHAPREVDLLERGASTSHRLLYRSELVRCLLGRLRTIEAVVAAARTGEPR
jgi:hypothetical protein